MASKKKWKKRFKQEQAASDSLVSQLVARDEELRRVDELLLNTELPGPTIEAWAQQVRDFFRELVKARGVVAGPIHQQFVEQPAAASSGPRTAGPFEDTGEYSLLEPTDIR